MLVEGPIRWLSKKQSAIALSSIEEEYRGVVNATTQCLWLQGILGECGIESKTSIVIYCDNQSTIRIFADLVQRQWTKNIEIHMHYIRQLVHDGTIDLLFCASSKQVADIFTNFFCEKTLSNPKSLLGIVNHVVNHGWWQDFQKNCFSYPYLREYFPTGFLPLSLALWTSSM